jgi:enoyl-CoA hydratase
MPEPVLLVEREGGVATLTLNRPAVLKLRAAITRSFRELAREPQTRVAILTGRGRAFCAGLDLKELGGEVAPAGADDTDMLAAIAAYEGPVIAAINGFAVTGGFELALACDVLVASSEARFADTHARVGILPGWGLSQKLSRLIGIHRAKELSFTGNYLDAQNSRFVPPAPLLRTCRELANDMLSCVPEVLRGYKRVIDAGFAASFGEGLAIEARAARENATRVTPGQIAARRRGVQQRGRTQGVG